MEDKRIEESNPKDLGFQLPIGVFNGKALKRDFSLREMHAPIERAVGRFKAENEELPSTAIISRLLSLMVSSIGGEPMSFDPNEQNEGKVIEAVTEINKLFLADVYYMYVKARIQELGPDYSVGFVCQNRGCKNKGPMKVDLNTMTVNTVKNISVLRRAVPLFKGLTYRDKTVKKTVYIQPMIWANMTSSEVSQTSGNEELLKLHFIKHCVVGVDGVEESIALTDKEIDSLRKIDIEMIAQEIDRINIGPSLIAKGKCKCGTDFIWPIDWNYDAFFTIASPF